MEDIQILQPFGPSIAKVTIPDEIIKLMNNYIDEVIKDEKKSEFLDGGYKLAGNVAQEFRLEGDFMKKIKSICVFYRFMINFEKINFKIIY